MLLGLLLMGIFLPWLQAVWAIYAETLGPAPPLSVGSFLRDMFTTNAGWVMIVAGGLFLGSIPLFLGLIVVMPVLGQVIWHLYREVV